MKLFTATVNKLRGIGAKTTISHIILAVMVLFFASIFTFSSLSNYLRSFFERGLLRRAKEVAKIETEYIGEEGDADRIRMYENISDAMVMFVDSNYVATHLPQEIDIAFTEGEHEDNTGKNNSLFIKTRILDAMDQYFLFRILDGEEISESRKFKFLSDEVFFAGAPVIDSNGNVVAGVVLIQPLDVYFTQTGAMLSRLLIVFAMSIVLAVCLSRWLSSRLTKPLSTIMQDARMLSEGEYGQRIFVSSRDEFGELAGALNALSTRLKFIIGSLRGERDKLDLVMNSIEEGIVAIDIHSRIIHLSQSYMEMMGVDKRIDFLDDNDRCLKLLKDSISDISRVRDMWTAEDGRRLLAIASPLHSDEHSIIGAVCLVRDVSEEERLEQLRRDYVANISHELRTPLTGIRGMIEPLMDGYMETEEEKQECYGVIYKETIRLEKLIREMLDMSRLQDGRQTVELELLCVNNIIEDALRRVTASASEQSVELVRDISETEITCLGNEDRILQIMTVFLDNALNFTPSGGTITAYARSETNRVIMGVRDTGCGIEPKDLPYIWERFYKVDKSRMRTAGTGLGLAIAKLLVELMHGEIGVSTEVGLGSDFWFSLKKS